MTLYLKYRPQRLEDLDLEVVRESLKKIVVSGKIPHAFLFAGPKGTGKTSAARILAKVVNCESTSEKLRGKGGFEPCNQCGQCTSITRGENLDVVEIDAASHRGIDDVRTIRDAVKLAPAKAKMKVYIIDEAHMLTTEASNALLKTLEEPPSHVIFILATTDPGKLIPTIRSRTTLINFKKASREELVRSLTKVAEGEKLKIDKEALETIAKYSDGSFRDGVKILEQIISEGVGFDKDEIENYLSKFSGFLLDEFMESLYKKDPALAIRVVEEAIEKGVSAKDIALKIVERLRIQLLSEVGIGEKDQAKFSKSELISLLKLFTSAARDISQSLIEQVPLEVAIVEWCGDGARVSNVGTRSHRVRDGEGGEAAKEAHLEEAAHPGEDVIQPGEKGGKANNQLDEEVWTRILSIIKPKNASTEALLRAARPLEFDGRILKLGVFYSFHKDRLESIPHRIILEETISQIMGSKIKVICNLVKPPEKKAEPEVVVEKVKESFVSSDMTLTEDVDPDIIKAAKEIFGN